jgi:DNA-binding response OmpR family regulator
LISRVFEERNPSWRIDHAASIRDAAKWLDLNIKKFPFLVISDYNLPDGTGLELAKNARVPEEVGFPLIILTGLGSEKLAVQALKSGVMDYVVKDTEDINLLPRTAVHAIRKWNLIILNTPQLCCGDGHETDLRLKHAMSIDIRIAACKPLCL